MMTPRYPYGCVAGSQVRRDPFVSPAAWSPASLAWFVYFNNGNCNNNHRSLTAFVRLVRSSSPRECQGASCPTR